jgi:hypothetical protein
MQCSGHVLERRAFPTTATKPQSQKHASRPRSRNILNSR